MSSRIRIVDLDEHDLVVTVRSTGEVEIELGADTDSKHLAHLLARIAREIHGPGQCEPKPAPDPASADDLAPMKARGGSLTGDRWTDGEGHVWDLSLIWIDGCRQRWMWAGRFDQSGAPIMRHLTGGRHMPLDAIRGIFGGPMRPAVSGGAR